MKSMPKLMIHWNNLIPCAIDVRTTGSNPFENDIIEIGIMAMDGFLKPADDRLPFELKIKAERHMNFDPEFISYKKLVEHLTNPSTYDPFFAADLFIKWFEHLQLREGKKFLPVAYNYPFMMPFLKFWLGTNNFDHMFDYRFRDILSLANAMNDAAAIRHHEPVFEKLDFPYICNVLGVSRGLKTPLETVHAVIECYRIMLSTRWSNSMRKHKEIDSTPSKSEHS